MAAQRSNKALKVPASKTAQDFYDAYLRFLDGQEKLVEKDLAEIVRVARPVPFVGAG